MLPMSKAKVVKMDKNIRIRYLFWFDLIISKNDKIYRSLSNVVNNVRRKGSEIKRGNRHENKRGKNVFNIYSRAAMLNTFEVEACQIN